MTPGKRKEITIFGLIGLALVASVFVAISGKGGDGAIGTGQVQSQPTPTAGK